MTTSRSEKLKSWSEYQEKQDQLCRKKPKIEYQEVYADDRSEKAYIIYDYERDRLELRRSRSDEITIPGKFFTVIQSALNILCDGSTDDTGAY